jgi:hypothetical protein
MAELTLRSACSNYLIGVRSRHQKYYAKNTDKITGLSGAIVPGLLGLKQPCLLFPSDAL